MGALCSIQSTSIKLRSDYTASELRRSAGQSTDAKQARRLLSLAAVYDGMDRQTLRDWVHRFNEAGPEGLADRKAPGRTRYLSDAKMLELGEVVEAGPNPAIDGVVR